MASFLHLWSGAARQPFCHFFLLPPERTAHGQGLPWGRSGAADFTTFCRCRHSGRTDTIVQSDRRCSAGVGSCAGTCTARIRIEWSRRICRTIAPVLVWCSAWHGGSWGDSRGMASVPPDFGNGKRGGGSGNAPFSGAGGSALADHLPPQNLEAERWLLGGILLDNEVLHEIAQFLTADDFYRDAHQVIYRAISELYSAGKGVDAVTLADELTRRDQFKQIGGDEMLLEIANSVPHAANARYHAELVRQKSISRQLIQSATDIIREGYSNLFTAQQLLESAEQKIFTIAEDQTRGDTR